MTTKRQIMSSERRSPRVQDVDAALAVAVARGDGFSVGATRASWTMTRRFFARLAAVVFGANG
ncbi:hypothetical protein D3C86_2110870 [compost metagenome]